MVITFVVCLLGIGVVSLFWYRFVSAQFASSGTPRTPPLALVIVGLALVGGDLGLGMRPGGFRGIVARIVGAGVPQTNVSLRTLAIVGLAGASLGAVVAAWSHSSPAEGALWALFVAELVLVPVTLGPALHGFIDRRQSSIVVVVCAVVALAGVVASWQGGTDQGAFVVLMVELVVLGLLVSAFVVARSRARSSASVAVLTERSRSTTLRFARASHSLLLVRLLRTRPWSWWVLVIAILIADLGCAHLALTSRSIVPAVGTGVLGLCLGAEMSLGATLADGPNSWLLTLGSRFGRLRRRSVLSRVVLTVLLLESVTVVFGLLGVVSGNEIPVLVLYSIAVAAIGCTGVATAEAVALRRGGDAVVSALLCGTVVLIVIPIGNVLNAMRQHQDPVVTAISSVTFLLIFVVGGLAYLVREGEGSAR